VRAESLRIHQAHVLPFYCLTYLLKYVTLLSVMLSAMHKKNPHAQALGRVGGRRRAALLLPIERRIIAQTAARARWRRYHADQEAARQARLAAKSRQSKNRRKKGGT
jgi:hypothetical protein